MQPPDHVRTHLNELGLDDPGTIHYNLNPAMLYEQALARNEGFLAEHGPLVTRTDPHTGRSPKDRFIVKEPATADDINWGEVNIPTEPEVFEGLLDKMRRYAAGRDLYVQDLFAGADRNHEMPVRIVTQKAWHSLFARNMFVRRHAEALSGFEPSFTVLDFCELEADPDTDGTHSEAFIIISFSERLVLIGGTHYAGEIKKSIFAALNYLLPDRGVLPMHSSANIGEEGDVAVFFGLSGTGKTTLSADKSRTLIGDDEHGWSDEGVYNFEGGCYAKMIDLSPEGEPEIYSTTKKFGTILENVIVGDEKRVPDFSDDEITKNTRGSYPIHYIPNASPAGQGGHADNIVMLTCDAFGVMPPVAKLTPEQAMYHFLNGYTAKIPGTESGIQEPRATFSACFGEPFMVRHPAEYAEMLGERIRTHDAQCWLINTGWTGGAYGTGQRIDLSYTRAMVDAALDGQLDDVETMTDGTFGLHIPTRVEGVPSEVLHPRQTWSDPTVYDEQAQKLAAMFRDNFQKYAEEASEEVRQAGPAKQAERVTV